MTDKPKALTREQIQSQVMIIDHMLTAASALLCDPENSTYEITTVVELAQDRAAKLNRALDCVSGPEVGA